MFSYDKKTMEAMAGPARDMFEQWISFFPTAPLFGVEWRFAKGMDLFPKEFQAFTPGFGAFAASSPAAKKPAGPAPDKSAGTSTDAKKSEKAKPMPLKVIEGADGKTAAVAETKSPATEKPAPVKPKAEASPEPVKSEATQPAAAAKDDGGTVDQIKGIGPRLAAELAGMGITTVAQIAAMTRADMAKVDAELTTIKGRCFRDDWIGQAKALMAA